MNERKFVMEDTGNCVQSIVNISTICGTCGTVLNVKPLQMLLHTSIFPVTHLKCHQPLVLLFIRYLISEIHDINQLIDPRMLKLSIPLLLLLFLFYVAQRGLTPI